MECRRIEWGAKRGLGRRCGSVSGSPYRGVTEQRKESVKGNRGVENERRLVDSRVVLRRQREGKAKEKRGARISVEEQEETELMKNTMKQTDKGRRTGRLRRSSKSAEGIKDGWSNERRNDKTAS